MSYFNFNYNTTLKELLKTSIDDDLLIDESCFDLFNKKILREYSEEELRLMITKKIALQVLVPFALDLLEENIFIQGDDHPGDLLEAVVSADHEFWESHIELRDVLRELIKKNISILNEAYSKLF